MNKLQQMIDELLGTFTQQELERLTGVDQGSISKFKNGKIKNPSMAKGDAIRGFYFSWKQEKAPAVQS
ncbi:hypothetical protein EC844_12566 [Acinetobacter calcoaceticus]|uniref:HTH cro/C1-type domain-containing protein n=1 Tax=Acinetobacter calcoaceticus TaxID=471 RepID=A0A4V2QZW7_ACICA|nr:hypothetical protein EC844_12566 [Acinetobacter calcoaceticus]